MTLVEFILARLGEDEAAARRALPGPWATGGEPRETNVYSAPTAVTVALGWVRDLEHVARHHPARVLAEVEAKRRIMDEWRRGDSDEIRETAWLPRLLALPHAGHPDYREEWRP